jgi:hypothetical protein
MSAESGIETIGIIGAGNIAQAFRSVGPRSRALRRVRRLVFPSALGEQYDLR